MASQLIIEGGYVSERSGWAILEFTNTAIVVICPKVKATKGYFRSGGDYPIVGMCAAGVYDPSQGDFVVAITDSIEEYEGDRGFWTAGKIDQKRLADYLSCTRTYASSANKQRLVDIVEQVVPWIEVLKTEAANVVTKKPSELLLSRDRRNWG